MGQMDIARAEVKKAHLIADLKKFFGTPEKPVSNEEFMLFWGSLSLEEKEYYKTAMVEMT